MAWTVGTVNKLTKVSIRTLHHYHAIGLLQPSERSRKGYRLDGVRDLERLQQILFFRELGFPLAEIHRIMSDPGFDRREAFLAQRNLLEQKMRRVQDMLEAIDAALDLMEKNRTMDEKEMFEAFGDFNPKQYDAEVKRRWGQTDAYRESARRTAKFKKEDWQRIRAEAETIQRDAAENMASGRAAGSPEMLAVIQRHWRYINENFCPCPPRMLENLANMWVDDPRFAANHEKIRPGLAEYMRDAAKAWAAQKTS